MAGLILTTRQMAAFEAKKSQPTASGCVEWLSARDACGYGDFMARPQRWRAHRLAYALEHGGIPDGLHVLHKCDNPACVNPAHLVAGTHRDNMQDMHDKGRKPTPPAFLEAARRDKTGSKNPHAKLTLEQVTYIRGSQEAIAQLAAMFGVCGNTVRFVRAGKTWGAPHG